MSRPKSSRAPVVSSRQISSACLFAVLLVIAACRSYHAIQTAPQVGGFQVAPVSAASNLFLGNPSAAGTNADNFLLVKPYFVVSYNNSRGEPNWVSWRLTRDDLGEAPRRNKFSTDQTLPSGFNLVSEKDYSNSGFDRGHMCPHGDRTKDKEMSYSTFVMSNVIPQSHNLNEKAWNSLEIYCRDLAKNDRDRLYIIDGPVGQGGTGIFGYKEFLAAKTVVVPAKCWKIIVVVPDDGTEDMADVTVNTRVIAVIMPNDETLGAEWQKFRVSVADVEQLTGYHFFSALPPNVAAALRTKTDRVTIAPPVVPQHFNEKRSKKETVPGDLN